MNFASDNVTGAAPEVMEALVEANAGTQRSYGNDDYTARLDGVFSKLFEREVAVCPVATGTAANALATAMLTPPYGAMYCHEESHVYLEECGAPELFAGGAKLMPVPGEHGRMDLDHLFAAIGHIRPGFVHIAKPSAISLTQAVESGVLYPLADVRRVGDFCREKGLGFHMDGARFANALATLGCSPAELTWKAGVDVLSFGGTKNGCLAVDAVVLFDPDRREELLYRRKRTGHLWSKTRFLAVQLLASIEDGRWLRWAAHANAMAARLSEGLAAIPGIDLVHPVEGNEIFATMPVAVMDAMEAAGVGFNRWALATEPTVRFVTAFGTDPADIDRVIEIASEAMAKAA
ncbi:MAG: low specificity L-threonine aldolase [Rhodospirillaceae bacterium]|jgi:threonine aldolase|nr:low specificity L-threonine aldolase [Rhodospirillaceae bacterium]